MDFSPSSTPPSVSATNERASSGCPVVFIQQRFVPPFGQTHAEDAHVVAAVESPRGLGLSGSGVCEDMIDERVVVCEEGDSSGAARLHQARCILAAEERMKAVADGLQKR